jgi:hypothetical protein
MFSEGELMVLLLGAVVMIVGVRIRDQLKELPGAPLIMGAFCFLLAGWTLTVAEGFFWKSFLNMLEHFCYAANAVLLCAWCWIAGREGEAR